jgi:hypothetical protein
MLIRKASVGKKAGANATVPINMSRLKVHRAAAGAVPVPIFGKIPAKRKVEVITTVPAPLLKNIDFMIAEHLETSSAFNPDFITA